MTTIVADLSSMAADQRCTSSGPFCHVQKIHRIKGALYGVAGDLYLALHVLEWLKGKRDPLELYKRIPDAHRDSVDILELSKDGLAMWSGWGIKIPILDATFAIGTGAPAALMAIRGGADPATAITLACGLDECSGVLVEPHVETLKVKR